jgi:hypothetical protein
MSAALFLQWWQRLRVESHFLGDGLVEPRGGGLQRAALVGAAKVGGELGQDHRSEDVAQPRRAGGRVTTTGPLPTMGTNCHALSLTSRAFVRLGPDLN